MRDHIPASRFAALVCRPSMYSPRVLDVCSPLNAEEPARTTSMSPHVCLATSAEVCSVKARSALLWLHEASRRYTNGLAPFHCLSNYTLNLFCSNLPAKAEGRTSEHAIGRLLPNDIMAVWTGSRDRTFLVPWPQAAPKTRNTQIDD